jgi:hypothetical protein
MGKKIMKIHIVMILQQSKVQEGEELESLYIYINLSLETNVDL